MSKTCHIFSALFALFLLLQVVATSPMSDGNKQLRWKDRKERPEDVYKYMEGSMIQSADFDPNAWENLLKKVDAEEKPDSNLRYITKKNSCGQRFLQARYGNQWKKQLDALTDIYMFEVSTMGFDITREVAKDHLLWGINEHLDYFLLSNESEERKKAIKSHYLMSAGPQTDKAGSSRSGRA